MVFYEWINVNVRAKSLQLIWKWFSKTSFIRSSITNWKGKILNEYKTTLFCIRYFLRHSHFDLPFLMPSLQIGLTPSSYHSHPSSCLYAWTRQSRERGQQVTIRVSSSVFPACPARSQTPPGEWLRSETCDVTSAWRRRRHDTRETPVAPRGTSAAISVRRLVFTAIPSRHPPRVPDMRAGMPISTSWRRWGRRDRCGRPQCCHDACNRYKSQGNKSR